MDELQDTILYYQQVAGGFHSTGVTMWQHEVDALLEFLPSGKHLIEIGCAQGVEALVLNEHYNYLGIDAASNLVDIAREYAPTARFAVLDLFDLPSLREQFDGFWCAATLLHIPKDRMVEALIAIKSVLAKGAVGFISLKEGTTEGWQSSEDGLPPRYYSYWTQKEFAKYLRKAGFGVIDVVQKNSYSRIDSEKIEPLLGFFVETVDVKSASE